MKIIFVCFALFSFKYSHAASISPLFGVGQETFNFTVSNISNNQKDIVFSPNIAGITRYAINANGFSFGISNRAPATTVDPQKGSKVFDFQLGYQRKNWGSDTFYQTYSGFYTQNTNQTQLFQT